MVSQTKSTDAPVTLIARWSVPTNRKIKMQNKAEKKNGCRPTTPPPAPLPCVHNQEGTGTETVINATIEGIYVIPPPKMGPIVCPVLRLVSEAMWPFFCGFQRNTVGAANAADVSPRYRRIDSPVKVMVVRVPYDSEKHPTLVVCRNPQNRSA